MWFYTAVLAAFINAISVIINKRLIKGVSAAVLTWATLVLATPIIFIFALQEGIPRFNEMFFIGAVGSVVFYTVAKVMGFRAMRMADLSVIYPLVSLGPIFTLFIAMFPPLFEKPSFLAIFGVLITLAGVYVLNAASVRKDIFEPIRSLFKNRASFLMMGAVSIDSVIIIFDKIAINNTFPQNTTFTLLVENLMVIFGLLPILYLRNKNFHLQVLGNVKLFLLLGFLNAASTILAFSAVGRGNVGLVTTILKMQILLVLFFSYLTFQDKPKIGTLIGSAVMILGIVLIKMGS